jgi:hypothetical protein
MAACALKNLLKTGKRHTSFFLVAFCLLQALNDNKIKQGVETMAQNLGFIKTLFCEK